MIIIIFIPDFACSFNKVHRLCNILLATPARGQRGPYCYDCQHVGKVEDCKNVRLCASDQVNRTAPIIMLSLGLLDWSYTSLRSVGVSNRVTYVQIHVHDMCFRLDILLLLGCIMIVMILMSMSR